MSDTGKQSPLGVNTLSSLLQNIGSKFEVTQKTGQGLNAKNMNIKRKGENDENGFRYCKEVRLG